MNVLLDTHVFIWVASDVSQLSEKAYHLIRDPEHVKWLSLVSVWEMQIKSQMGKLILQKPLGELIEEQQEQNSLQVLPITLPHILALDELPFHHRDPFDRLLIAQSIQQGFVLLSRDAVFTEYGVDVQW
ncbi:MAG: type II toxin-antitoxin system VapC family toxin [Phototrophicaceae bacterium]